MKAYSEIDGELLIAAKGYGLGVGYRQDEHLSTNITQKIEEISSDLNTSIERTNDEVFQLVDENHYTIEKLPEKYRQYLKEGKSFKIVITEKYYITYQNDSNG